MEDRLAQPMAVHVVGVKIPFLDFGVLLVNLALAMISALFIIIDAVSAAFRGVLELHCVKFSGAACAASARARCAGKRRGRSARRAGSAITCSQNPKTYSRMRTHFLCSTITR